MKILLKYQNSEYDCGPTSFINALAYLYEREEVPIELIKAIYEYTLDVKNSEGIVGKGGTSREKQIELGKYFNKTKIRRVVFQLSIFYIFFSKQIFLIVYNNLLF